MKFSTKLCLCVACFFFVIGSPLLIDKQWVAGIAAMGYAIIFTAAGAILLWQDKNVSN